MRFAVVGVGGAGGYFGGMLVAAGHDVTFIARGEHLAAMRDAGLRIERPDGEITVKPALVTDRASDAGVVDCVLLGVKAWQVDDAARSAAPLVGPSTAVLPLQNGVEASEQIAAALGAQHALGATTKIISMRVGPGHIRYVGVEPTLEIGELDGAHSPRIEALHAALSRTPGITAKLSADILAAIWSKFLFIASWSGVGAVVRAPVGVIRDVPETRSLIERAMAEIVAVGTARGVRLVPDAVASAMAYLDTMPPHGTTSMQRDLAAGNPSELDSLTGAASRLGAAVGVATPVHSLLHDVLVTHERRARGLLA